MNAEAPFGGFGATYEKNPLIFFHGEIFFFNFCFVAVLRIFKKNCLFFAVNKSVIFIQFRL